MHGYRDIRAVSDNSALPNSALIFARDAQTSFAISLNGGGARIGWPSRVISINSIVPTGTIELWKNGKHARRKPGTPLWFRKCADDKRAGFWNLIEIREQFDLVVIGAQNVGLE